MVTTIKNIIISLEIIRRNCKAWATHLNIEIENSPIHIHLTEGSVAIRKLKRDLPSDTAKYYPAYTDAKYFLNLTKEALDSTEQAIEPIRIKLGIQKNQPEEEHSP